MTLTSRQRVNAAMEHRDHDRVPRFDSPWPETIERWHTQGFEGDRETFRDWLLSDIAMLCWSWPVPYPGQEKIISEDEHTKVVLDKMDKIQRVWKHKSGTPEHIGFGCDSRDKWDQQYKPALLSHAVQIDSDAVEDQAVRAREKQQWTCLAGIESFEAIRQLMGDQITLVAMAAEPDWIRDLSRTYTDLILLDYQAVLDRGLQPDGVWVFGDVGYNHGTFFSPQMYRELIWPDHVRLCEWAHERDMKFIYHTDGDVRAFLDLFVEAGFDCIQPMEAKAGMDVRELAPRYGKELAFFGNIDMTVASTNDLDKIEHEVVSKLRAGMANQGYLFHSDHSIPPQVDWSTYQFIVSLVERYGRYE